MWYLRVCWPCLNSPKLRLLPTLLCYEPTADSCYEGAFWTTPFELTDCCLNRWLLMLLYDGGLLRSGTMIICYACPGCIGGRPAEGFLLMSQSENIEFTGSVKSFSSLLLFYLTSPYESLAALLSRSKELSSELPSMFVSLSPSCRLLIFFMFSSLSLLERADFSRASYFSIVIDWLRDWLFSITFEVFLLGLGTKLPEFWIGRVVWNYFAS